MENFKNFENALSRSEMRSISAGIKDHRKCLDWPGCFSDCDCGVYNCNNTTGAWVFCATVSCTDENGTLSTNRRCSC